MLKILLSATNSRLLYYLLFDSETKCNAKRDEKKSRKKSLFPRSVPAYRCHRRHRHRRPSFCLLYLHPRFTPRSCPTHNWRSLPSTIVLGVRR